MKEAVDEDLEDEDEVEVETVEKTVEEEDEDEDEDEIVEESATKLHDSKIPSFVHFVHFEQHQMPG